MSWPELLAGALVVAWFLPAATASAAGDPQRPRVGGLEPPRLEVSELPQLAPWPWELSPGSPARLEYQVDLDLLAPLGTGPGNAATFLAQFAYSGDRAEEWQVVHSGAVEVSILGKEQRVLPFDAPFLAEAEPWIDQATCRFYPGIFKLQGTETQVPNLIVALVLGRSWMARGLASEDPAASRADLRRTVRLGRLLLQDNLMIVQELVGITLIRLGSHGLYEVARRHGDGATTTLAALAVSESATLELEYRRRHDEITSLGLGKLESRGLLGFFFGPTLDTSDRDVKRLIEIVEVSNRPLRSEALLALYMVKHLGKRRQRNLALETLNRLAGDADPLVAAVATWYRDHDLPIEILAELRALY